MGWQSLCTLSLPFLRQEILSSIPLVYMPSRRVEIVSSYTAGEHIQIPFFWLQEATLIGPSPKQGNCKIGHAQNRIIQYLFQLSHFESSCD
jgi:hypothetical protein